MNSAGNEAKKGEKENNKGISLEMQEMAPFFTCMLLKK
jgi:hypothetical protein